MPSHDGVPLVEARGLQRSFGQARILRGLDLSLGSGEALLAGIDLRSLGFECTRHVTTEKALHLVLTRR